MAFMFSISPHIFSRSILDRDKMYIIDIYVLNNLYLSIKRSQSGRADKKERISSDRGTRCARLYKLFKRYAKFILKKCECVKSSERGFPFDMHIDTRYSLAPRNIL